MLYEFDTLLGSDYPHVSNSVFVRGILCAYVCVLVKEGSRSLVLEGGFLIPLVEFKW